MDDNREIGPGEHLDATGERKVVFCHQCENEWWHDEHDLICPRCEGEATEIVEPDHDPRDLGSPEDNLPSLRDLHNHSPWASTSADSDPEEADIEEHITRGPGGSIMISQTIHSNPVRHRSRPEPTRRRSSNPYARDRASEDPNRYIMREFQGMMANLMNIGPGEGPPRPGGPDYEDHFPRPGEGGGRRPWQPFFEPIEEPTEPRQRNRNGSGRGFSFHTHTHEGPFLGSRVTLTAGRIGGQNRALPEGPEGPPVDDLAMLLSNLFGNMVASPAGDNQTRDGPGRGPGRRPIPPFLAALLNPANAASGDAVYTQEALDRVISQLMEAHPTSSSAPGPASPQTITSLPKRALTDKDLEGNKKVIGKNGEEEMKGECSVCMDDVGVGEEMVFLPCKHWFHEACASAWLSEHDSCPICRKSISPGSNSNSNNNDGGNGSGSRGGIFRRASGTGAARFSNNWGSTFANPSNASSSSNTNSGWRDATRPSIFTPAGRRERARERQEREAERVAEEMMRSQMQESTGNPAHRYAREMQSERRRAQERNGSGSDGHSRWTSPSNGNYGDTHSDWGSDRATRGSTSIPRRFTNYGRSTPQRRETDSNGTRDRSTSPPGLAMPGAFPPRRDSARSSRSGTGSGSGTSSSGNGGSGVLNWVRDRISGGGSRRGDST